MVFSSVMALAHAEYERSVPAANAVLREKPSSVVVYFTQPVEVRLSTFGVYALEAPREAWGNPSRLRQLAQPLVRKVLASRGSAGRRVDMGVATTARTSRDVILRLRPDLEPGPYVVVWRNLGVDGHSVVGFFVFVYRS
ncbi:MAG: copper resistance protein CopC [Meiothermus sp.]|nr:copper resistance protein CopC [Meiothermus sp.]